MKTTKNILLTLIGILIILLFIQACEKQHDNSLVSEHVLKKDETIIIANGSKKTAVTLLNIQDSRCKPGVQCVWEGYGTAQLKVEEEDEIQNITICIGACELMSMHTQETLVLNGINYEIKLIGLTDDSAKIRLNRS